MYYFWLCRVFLAVGFFSSRSGCGAPASHCSGFSCCRAQAVGGAGFNSCSSKPLEHRFSSCGIWASLFLSTWDLPGPGMEPTSPAWHGDSLLLSHQGSPESEMWKQTYTQNITWCWRQRLERCIYKPRNTKDPTPGRLFPQSLGGEHGPAHTLFWTFSLQNCETIIFSCFKSPALWYPVMAALEHGDTIICLFFYLNLVRRFSC